MNEKLIKIKNELNQLFKVKEADGETARTAEQKYTDLLTEVMDSRPDLKKAYGAMNEANAIASVTKEMWKEVRSEYSADLESYFQNNQVEQDSVPGVSFRYDRKHSWLGSGINLVLALADRGLFWLLQPNEKLAAEIVQKNSVLESDSEDERRKLYIMPDHWEEIAPHILVKTICKPQISESKFKD